MTTRKSSLPATGDKAQYVNRMFAQIAPTYDLMNRLMTGGQDRHWREQAVHLCRLPPQGSLLDVGTGTGDLAATARQIVPGISVVPSDFTYEMMGQGRRRPARRRLPYTQADALHLPFADHTFDAAVSGFLIRNVAEIHQAFREQARVVKPGGRVVCLEITPPNTVALSRLFQLYFFHLVPLVGSIISGHPEAYRYLPHSTVAFPDPGLLQRHMEQAGLVHVFYVNLMMGSVAIHVGTVAP